MSFKNNNNVPSWSLTRDPTASSLRWTLRSRYFLSSTLRLMSTSLNVPAEMPPDHVAQLLLSLATNVEICER